MGTWGDGNFESDVALDMLAVWRRKIIDTIREAFTLPSEDRPYDGQGDSHIVANVDILATLCEHYSECPNLGLEEISEWKQNYLHTYAVFTQRFTRIEDRDSFKKRLEIVEATFDRLYQVVKNLCED